MVKIPTPKLININELKPNTKNVKQHPKEQIQDLARLMDYVGFKDPIVIDEDYTIFAGHGRLEAAKLKGMTEVPCVFMENLTDEQKKWFLLADNRINESEWNEDNVKLMLEDIGSFTFEDFNMKFDDFEIKVTEELEEIPEPPPEPKAKLGDVYQLGEHRVMCGDSTKDLDTLLDKEIDLLLTDPPYGMNLNTDWTGAKSNLKFIEDKKAFGGNRYNPVLNDDVEFNPTHLLKYKEVILWGADYYADKLPKDGSWFVWDKRLTDDADKMYGSTFELCWSKIPHKRDILRVKWAGIFGTETQDIKKRVHPTQKPLEVSTYFIEKLTKENNTVLDCYLGSGSTLIACEQTNRICYGMELDPAYIDVIIERWENFTNQKAIKVQEGDIQA